MSRGPIDFTMVRFPEAGASIRVAEGLKTLIDAGTIAIIDLIFVTRTAEDGVAIVEMNDLAADERDAWASIVQDVEGVLTEEDAMLLVDALDVSQSAVLALYENTWAREMSRIIADAHGEVLISDRIPRVVIDQILADQD